MKGRLGSRRALRGVVAWRAGVVNGLVAHVRFHGCELPRPDRAQVVALRPAE